MDPRLLVRSFESVRARTISLCAPLSTEDHVVQPMPDASPAKWHLAHTTWFFETFVLAGTAPFDPVFGHLFNSYYEAVGPRLARASRGMLTRPSLERIHAYRAAVDHRIGRALVEELLDETALMRLELGLHHEQQHQELILTDLKYTLGTQPLAPAYRTDLCRPPVDEVAALGWRRFDGGIAGLGAGAGFAFDNERPRHDLIVRPFELATRPISNAEVLAFIADGGYADHRLWLSDGWSMVQREGWRAPLYWSEPASRHLYELAGRRAIEPAETACHLSYYEADAIARWLEARLPTEAEWELAATPAVVDGNLADVDRLHPTRADAGDDRVAQLFGDVWEWTSSSYAPYPGFRPLDGALGEYNGKFMSGQQVLRGGSCFTPRDHVRASYRNFFPPSARWQMTGVRLARDC